MKTGITEKAMLVNLKISCWSARKHDKSVSAKVAHDYNTPSDSGRYNKVLIAENAIKAIKKHVGNARTFHYENTLPWNDEGSRILPAKNFDRYSQKMRELKTEYETAVSEFLKNYTSLVENAKIRLNGMFKDSDYPGINEIRNKFSFTTIINPIPNNDDFRVSLNSTEVERIKTELGNRLREAEKFAKKDLWNRLYSVLNSLSSKMREEGKNGKSPIFRDSLIGNVKDIVNLLPDLCISEDPDLEKIRTEIKETIATMNPEDLRKTTNEERGKAARKAESIMDKMSDFMGGME